MERNFWQTTYDFSEGDVKVVERMDEWTDGEFQRSLDPKDGYSLRDLKDPEARIVIGFLNPIVHPEKPKRIVHKWASIFFDAMRGKCTVGWAELMTELVQRLVAEVRKGKKTGSPLPVYIAHMYSKYQVLGEQEQNDYNDAVKLHKYGGPETESEAIDPDPSPSKEPGRESGRRRPQLLWR